MPTTLMQQTAVLQQYYQLHARVLFLFKHKHIKVHTQVINKRLQKERKKTVLTCMCAWNVHVHTYPIDLLQKQLGAISAKVFGQYGVSLPLWCG